MVKRKNRFLCKQTVSQQKDKLNEIHDILEKKEIIKILYKQDAAMAMLTTKATNSASLKTPPQQLSLQNEMA